MSESVSFTVPEQTTACFVVATDGAPGDLQTAALRRLPAPFEDAALVSLGSPRLAIASYPARYSPWSLARVTADDGNPDGATRARDAVQHIGVTATLPAPDRPLGLQTARAVARAIAEHLDAVTVDLDTGQALAPHTDEPPDFLLSDGWLGARLPESRDDTRCTVTDEEIDGCSCVRLTTRGLTRLGLPELQISGVSCPHDLAALNVLRTTAQSLLPAAARAGTCSVPRNFFLTSEDFSTYWGTPTQLWSEGPVQARLTSLGPHLLAVGPPEAFPGNLNEWLWDELPPVLYDLLSC